MNPSNASVTKLTVQPSAESQGHVTYENEILSLGEVGDKTKVNLYYVDAIDERSSIKPTIDSKTKISHNRLYISAWPVLDAITFEKTKVDIYGINKVINNYSDSCSWIPNQIYYRKTYPEDYRYPYPYPEVTWDDNLIDVTDFHTIYEDGGDFIITPKASATEDVTTKISVATNRMSGSFDVVLHPPKDITQILFYDSAAITSLNVAKNISSKTIEVSIQPPWSGNGREYVTAVSSDATLVSVVSLTFDDEYSEGQVYKLILASHDIAGNATITVTAKNMSAGLAVTVTA